MDIFKNALDLLGQSENAPAVVSYLQSLGIGQPIARPPRDERGTNVEVIAQPQIELFFTRASELPQAEHFAKGELVLASFFIHPAEPGGAMEGMPLGIDMAWTRAQARARLGEPEWTSKGSLKNDRWLLEGKRVLLCFTSDEQRIRQLAVSQVFA
ncbi:MAG: hypothetical protein ACO1PM_07805 [Acidovorax sp.]